MEVRLVVVENVVTLSLSLSLGYWYGQFPETQRSITEYFLRQILKKQNNTKQNQPQPKPNKPQNQKKTQITNEEKEIFFVI